MIYIWHPPPVLVLPLRRVHVLHMRMIDPADPFRKMRGPSGGEVRFHIIGNMRI